MQRFGQINKHQKHKVKISTGYKLAELNSPVHYKNQQIFYFKQYIFFIIDPNVESTFVPQKQSCP